MNIKIQILIVIILKALICLTRQSLLFSQSLDNLKEQQPLLINGYLSTNQVYTRMPADTGYLENYNHYYTGSIVFNVYGVTAPFTFVYSNRETNLSYPFNQFGLHPSYKWLKAHIGYASMNFTPYTYSGHLFAGGGIEADPPGIFRGKAMYGRLKKYVEYDSAHPRHTPSYKRLGYGVQAGIEKNEHFLDLTLFRGYDVLESSVFIPAETGVLPRDNTAVSVSFGVALVKNIRLTSEYANSYLTTDKRGTMLVNRTKLFEPPTWFMPVKTTTISRNAFNANATYNHSRYSLGVGYERIDPYYQTLGAYYFTNNLENATLNVSANFFDHKLSFNGNGGLQKDNLDQSKANTSNRVVGSMSVNYVPGDKLNLNLSYSNFTSYTNVRSNFEYVNQTEPYDNWDTLDFRQISQNMNLNSNYRFISNEKQRHAVNMNITYQTSDDQQGETSNKGVFYNINTSYILSLIPVNLNISLSYYMNRNQVATSDSYTMGPAANVSKLFLNKTLRTSLSFSYNASETNNVRSGETYNIRANASYKLKKQHNFNLNFLHQIRNYKNTLQNHANKTLTITFGYTYNFNLIKAKNEQNEETSAGEQ